MNGPESKNLLKIFMASNEWFGGDLTKRLQKGLARQPCRAVDAGDPSLRVGDDEDGVFVQRGFQVADFLERRFELLSGPHILFSRPCLPAPIQLAKTGAQPASTELRHEPPADGSPP